jgi:hypothetical protein
MAGYPRFANGTTTKVEWWVIGHANQKKQFPMHIITIRHSGITTTSIDTTHLASEAPTGREFGGRTSIPAILRNPGQVTMEGFLNPQSVLPQDEFFMQIIFPKAKGYKTRAKWVGLGHLQSIGDIIIPTDDAMKQTCIFQYSGVVAMIAAQKV